MLTLIGMKKNTLLFIISILALAACKKSESPKEKPEIVFTGLSHNTVTSGDLKDTILINLRYTMAVSSVGADTTLPVLYFQDSRDQTVAFLSFPGEISGKLPDAENNISGNITLRLNVSNYLVVRPDRPNGDTVQYEIYLKDVKNGKESNRVTTPDIYIMP